MSPKKEEESGNGEQKTVTVNEGQKISGANDVQSECQFPLTRIEWVGLLVPGSFDLAN